jgi:HSP20 family protein
MTRMMQNAPRRSTNLAPWNPVDELDRMYSELSRFLGGFTNMNDSPEQPFIPLADIEETDDAYIIELEVPGVSREDVTIEAKDRRVTIGGELKERERTGILRRQTRRVGRFNFEAVLPSDVDETGASARLENGVLTVRVPKAADAQARRIEVS